MAITGDSISTLQGVSTVGNAIFYDTSKQAQFGIRTVADTWWGQLAEKTGAKIVSNDAWSGSKVSGDEAGSLAKNRTRGKIASDAEVLLIMIGINDLAGGKDLGVFDSANIVTDRYDTIANAYSKMLADFQQVHPTARIICITPLKMFNSTTWAERKGGINNDGKTVTELGDLIKKICTAFGVECIDGKEVGFHTHNARLYLPDGVHPNKAGATRMAEVFMRKI